MPLKISTCLKKTMFRSLLGSAVGSLSLRDGRIGIYTGTQPASADAALTGSLLGVVTKSAGEYSPGVYQTADDDNVCASQSVTSGVNMTLNGAGAGTLGVGYFVTITSAGTEDLRTANFRITGTNNDDETIVEYIDGGNNATVYTSNQFKTVTEIYPRKPAAFSSNVKVGYAITNGLVGSVNSSAVLGKNPAQTWQVKWIANGTAGYFRWMGDDADDGSLSTNYPRIDGNIGTAGAIMNLSNLTAVIGAIATVDSVALTWPSTL